MVADPVAEGIFTANALGDRSRQVRAQRAQRRRDEAARNALAAGNINRAAALNPELTSQFQDVQGTQFEQQSAAEDRKLSAALRLARAGEQAVSGGADPLQVFDTLAQRAGGLFGSEEELLETRAIVEEMGPEAFSVIRKGLFEQSKVDRTPAAIREFEFAQTLPEDQRRQFMEIKRGPQTFEIGGSRRLVVPGSGGGETETLVAPSETAQGERVVEEAKQTGKSVGKAVIEDLDTKFSDARQANVTLQQTARARELLDEGVIAGSLPQQRLALARAIQTSTGVDIPETASTAEYVAIVSEFVAQNIKAFGAGTGLSDADREFAKAMSGGDLAGGLKALERILNITENKAREKIKQYNDRRGTVVKRNSDFGDLYPELEVPGTKESVAPADIPVGAVDLLRNDPSLAEQFDAKYGSGAAASVLNGG